MPAMRDGKGRFKKGFDGMRPVGMKDAKLASFKKKQPEKTLNVPIADSGRVRFGPDMKTAPAGARVNVNVGAIDRGASARRPGDKPGQRPTIVKTGGAMITKTQGDVVRGQRNDNGLAGVKLSKGQQDRLATRDKNMLTGARNKKRGLAGGEQVNSMQTAQAANNAKLQDARTMTPAQKIENYQEMHGKAPSAAATKKLEASSKPPKFDRNAAIESDRRNRELQNRQARAQLDAMSKPGPDRASIAFTNDGIAARQANKPQMVRKSTADMVREQDARDKAAELQTKVDAASANSAAKKARADALYGTGQLKPAGADQQKVVPPKAQSAGAGDLTHDQALANMNNASAALDRAKAARIARGGKTTSAEEKRLKADFENARKIRQDIALRNANSKPSAPVDPKAQAASDAMSAAARARAAKPVTGGRSSSQKADLGSLLTDFAEKKGISESELKAGGGEQKTVVPPKGRYAKELSRARIPTRNTFGGDWKQNRAAAARTERRVAQMKVEKADQWGERKVTLNGKPQGSISKRTEGAPVMDGRIRIGSMAAKGFRIKPKNGRDTGISTSDNRVGHALGALSERNDLNTKGKAQKRLNDMKSGVESRKRQRREAPRMAELLNKKIIDSQSDPKQSQWNRTKQQRLDQEKTIRQRNLAERLARQKGNRARLLAGRNARMTKLELKRTADADGVVQTEGFSGNIAKLRNGKFADLDRGTYTKDAWPRESNGVQITTQTNKRTGVVRVRSVPLIGSASNTYYVNKKAHRKAELKRMAERNAAYRR